MADEDDELTGVTLVAGNPILFEEICSDWDDDEDDDPPEPIDRRAYYEQRLREEGLSTDNTDVTRQRGAFSREQIAQWGRDLERYRWSTPHNGRLPAPPTRPIMLSADGITYADSIVDDRSDMLVMESTLNALSALSAQAQPAIPVYPTEHQAVQLRAGGVNYIRPAAQEIASFNTNEPITNNEEGDMAKADKDYSLLDMKRLDISLIRRKVDRIEEMDAAAKGSLCEDYVVQVDYLIKLATSYPQILKASYLELMGLSGEPAGFVPCLSDRGQLNKRVMEWLSANEAPPLPVGELTADELEFITGVLASKSSGAVDVAIQRAESDLLVTNNNIRGFSQSIADSKAKIAEYEGKIAELYRRKHTSNSEEALLGLMSSQVGLIQSKLGWTYEAFYDEGFWFRTPVQFMTMREGGTTKAVETCSYLVHFKPLTNRDTRGWYVYAVTGNMINRQYGCPFHSGRDWCYGSADSDVRDQLQSGDMFAAARTMQFLMTTYQADGPYRSFRDYKNQSTPLINWTYASHLGSSGNFRNMVYIYGSGDWRSMVERALSGQVHLDGDYTRPLVRVSSDHDRHDHWFKGVGLNDPSAVATAFDRLIRDHVEARFWDVDSVDVNYLVTCNPYLSEEEFHNRVIGGEEFGVLSLQEDDHDSCDLWREYYVDFQFRDGRKASYCYRIDFTSFSGWEDRYSDENNLDNMRSQFTHASRFNRSNRVDLNLVEGGLYDGINQARIKALQLLPREVLERGSLTEIVNGLSGLSLPDFGRYRETSRLESLDKFDQSIQEADDVSDNEL